MISVRARIVLRHTMLFVPRKRPAEYTLREANIPDTVGVVSIAPVAAMYRGNRTLSWPGIWLHLTLRDLDGVVGDGVSGGSLGPSLRGRTCRHRRPCSACAAAAEFSPARESGSAQTAWRS